ncbi:hypothetical protein Tco_1365660 [Tanacetum coccineum]
MIKNSSRPLLYSSKSNESKEKEGNSNRLLVSDEFCKDEVRCDEVKLNVSVMDDNGNSKEVGEGSIGSVGCEEIVIVKGVHEKLDKDNALRSFKDCFSIVVKWSGKQRIVGSGLEIEVDKFVNEDDEGKGYVSLSFKKEIYINLGSQEAVPETLYFSPTVVGANEHTICLNKGCIKKGVGLFRICCDLKHVEGLIDKDKGCNMAANGCDVCRTNPESSIKIVGNRLFNDQKLTSGFNANKIENADVGINLKKEVASDITTADVLNLETPKSTKGGLELVQHGKGLIVNMVGIEGNNVMIVDQPLSPFSDFSGKSNSNLRYEKWELNTEEKKKQAKTEDGIQRSQLVIRDVVQKDQTKKVNNGTRVHDQVSDLVPESLLDLGNIEVPAIDFVHKLVLELLDVDEDTRLALVDTLE